MTLWPQVSLHEKLGKPKFVHLGALNGMADFMRIYIVGKIIVDAAKCHTPRPLPGGHALQNV